MRKGLIYVYSWIALYCTILSNINYVVLINCSLSSVLGFGQITISNCTSEHDTVCGCGENQYQTNESPEFFCKKCSSCQNGTIRQDCECSQNRISLLMGLPRPHPPSFWTWNLCSALMQYVCTISVFWQNVYKSSIFWLHFFLWHFFFFFLTLLMTSLFFLLHLYYLFYISVVCLSLVLVSLYLLSDIHHICLLYSLSFLLSVIFFEMLTEGMFGSLLERNHSCALEAVLLCICLWPICNCL